MVSVSPLKTSVFNDRIYHIGRPPRRSACGRQRSLAKGKGDDGMEDAREATIPSIHQQLLENTLSPETPKPAFRGPQNCCAGGLKMLSRRACFAPANRHVQILSACMRKTNHALYSNWGPASTEPIDKKMLPSIMCHAQYHKIIDHYVNKGDVDSVENIMAEMNRNGIPPNISTVNKLLATYTVRKDGMGAQKVMDEMYKAGIVPDNSSISQLMNAYTSEGNFEAADSVVKAAIRNDIVLDTELMNEIMRSNLISKNPAGAEKVLSGILEMELTPNVETIAILIRVYASLGDIDGAVKTINGPRNLKFTITTPMINGVLEAFNNCQGTDHWDKVVELHKEHFMSDKLIPDCDTYVQLLLVCGKYGRTDDALFFFEEYKSTGKKVTNEIRQALCKAVGDDLYNQQPGKFNYDPQKLEATMNKFRAYMIRNTPSVVDTSIKLSEDDLDKTRLALDLSSTVPMELKDLNDTVRARIDIGDLEGAMYTIFRSSQSTLLPDKETILLLVGASASHGDHATAESICQQLFDTYVTSRDINISNQLIRAHSVKGHTAGAEEALYTMPFLNLAPNSETMLFVLMGFANNGNYIGIERFLGYFLEAGHTITTPAANFILKAVIMNRKKNYNWDDFLAVYHKYFGSDGVAVDNDTYVQIFLACQKYNREEEAITLFDELINSNLTIAPIVRNIFRLVIDNEEISNAHTDLRDFWEIEESAVSCKGTDLQTNYQLVWANTPKKIKRANVPKRASGVKKIPFELISGTDENPVKKVSYGSDVKSVTAKMESREQAGMPIGSAMMVALIAAYSAANDPESAYRIMKEKALLGLKPDLTVFQKMINAFSAVGNYEGAESVLTYYGQTGHIPGYLLHLEIVRAYSVYGDAGGAERAFYNIKRLKMMPSIEANHLVMQAYASLGKLNLCETFFNDCVADDFKPSAVTVNILLAAHLYNSEGFNIMAFMSCYRKHFLSSNLEPNRFTYIQLLLGCEKARSTTEAVQIFNTLLKSDIQITIAMRETFRRTVGGRFYDDFLTTLSPELKARMDSIDKLESEPAKAKPIEYKMKPGVVVKLGTSAMTSKRVYVPRPPTR